MALQAEIAHKIITRLRTGTIQDPVNGKKFTKVIVRLPSNNRAHILLTHVSSTSATTATVPQKGHAIAATYPNDINAFVLTGYTGRVVEGLIPLAAGTAEPAQLVMPRFATLPVGPRPIRRKRPRLRSLHSQWRQGLRPSHHKIRFRQLRYSRSG